MRGGRRHKRTHFGCKSLWQKGLWASIETIFADWKNRAHLGGGIGSVRGFISMPYYSGERTRSALPFGAFGSPFAWFVMPVLASALKRALSAQPLNCGER
jgi:hypothetical protein